MFLQNIITLVYLKTIFDWSNIYTRCFLDFNYLPKDAKRYRYLYIDEEYRGNDLSYKMLNYLVKLFIWICKEHSYWMVFKTWTILLLMSMRLTSIYVKRIK